MENQKNIIFFGAPGVGKGTQSKKLSAELDIPHIDTGNLIREAISTESPLGVKAKSFVEAGKLVPDELVIDMIREKLIFQKNKGFKGFVLDGFPRTIGQATALDNLLGLLKFKITKVINVQAPEEILIGRLSSRRTCTNKSCGTIYNVITQKPEKEGICDRCSSPLYQRKDDSEEASKQRLEEYHIKTAPLEKYYRDKKLVADIDGTKSPEEVFQDIVGLLNSLTAVK